MTISAYLGSPGLTDVGYTFYNGNETANGSRITAGVLDAADGWYSATGVTIPGGADSVRWNSIAQPTLIAREYFPAPATVDVNAIAVAVWNILTSTLTTAGSVGKLVKDNLDATVSSRAATGAAMTLTSAYDAAKVAASQASVNAVDDFVDTEVAAIKAVTDKLDTTLEADAAIYRFTTNALEQAPVGSGGGGTDWTETEKEQIRFQIGIDGATSIPSAAYPNLATASAVDNIQTSVTAMEGIQSEHTVVLDEITTKTINLPPDPASLSALADLSTQASVDSVQTVVDLINNTTTYTNAVTNKLDTALEADGGVFRYTANALEQAPVGDGGGGAGDASQATLLEVKAKTDALPPDPADASDVAAQFAAVNAKLDDKTGFSLSPSGIDAVWAKTMTELSSVPGVTASALSALQWIFLLARNKITQNATTQALRNDADSATIGAAPVSDDGTTFTRGEFA